MKHSVDIDILANMRGESESQTEVRKVSLEKLDREYILLSGKFSKTRRSSLMISVR